MAFYVVLVIVLHDADEDETVPTAATMATVKRRRCGVDNHDDGDTAIVILGRKLSL